MTSFPSCPTLSAVREWYAQGGDPEQGLCALARRIRRDSANGVWITLIDENEIRERVRELKAACATLPEEERRARYPLLGIPFAVKDNMDVAGKETTAACPAYAYAATSTAFVVQRLLDAGAVLMGKTNMDQFATGLVGVRSPYGACPNSFDGSYISGGSSSGSAHVVAKGYVSFSLGTDTAGSGRVPAALNNLVGLKPSHGLLSTSGVVPACPSLDCVSVFALTCEDASEVFQAAQAPDDGDVWSREAPSSAAPLGDAFTFGVPEHLDFCGNEAWEAAFRDAVARLESLGGTAVPVDYAPYREAANMLYFGPYLAERMAVVGDFVEKHPECCDATVHNIICGASHWTAVDTFRTIYRTLELRQVVAQDFRRADVLLLPTAPTTYTIDAVRRDPLRTNVNMGTYTNFVNILDLCAVAVPSSVPLMPGTDVAMPFGVTLMAPAFSEARLLNLASRFHAAARKEGLGLGATEATPSADSGSLLLAVGGAHMSGMPLCRELESTGASFAFAASTAPHYRMKLLPGGAPLRPAIVRVEKEGVPIQVEVWSIPRSAVGVFLERIPAPLGLGSVELSDGSWVKGFICGANLSGDARDISEFGSFRVFMEQEGNAASK